MQLDAASPTAASAARAAASAASTPHTTPLPWQTVTLCDGDALAAGDGATVADAGVVVADGVPRGVFDALGVGSGVTDGVADAGVGVALHDGPGTTAARNGPPAVGCHAHAMTPADHHGAAAATHEPRVPGSTQPLEPSVGSTSLPRTRRAAGTPYDAISASAVPGKAGQSAADEVNRPACVE